MEQPREERGREDRLKSDPPRWVTDSQTTAPLARARRIWSCNNQPLTATGCALWLIVVAVNSQNHYTLAVLLQQGSGQRIRQVAN